MNRRAKWGVITVLTVGLMSPLLWQGLQPNYPNKPLSRPQIQSAKIQALQALQARKQGGNDQAVAQDIARTAALCVRDCRIALTTLANELAHVHTRAERLRVLQQHMVEHPQFVSLTLRDGNNAPLQVGSPLRGDLQNQAHLHAMKDNFYISDLYTKPAAKSQQEQIGMTLGVPMLSDHNVTGSVTSDVEMGHLQSVIKNQDSEMGTTTRLIGMDGHNEMLGTGAAQAKGGIHTQQVNAKTTQARVQGTNWRVHVTSVKANGIKQTHRIPDEVLVRYDKDLTPGQIHYMTADIKGSLVRSNSRHAYIFRSDKMPQKDVVRYFKQHGAAISEPHTRLIKNQTDSGTAPDEPNDEFYGTNQWNLPQISADTAWMSTTGSPNVTIAIVDTGVDYNHPEFQGKLVSGMNMLNQSAKPQDDNGHGTHVAGIIAARTNNVQGVAGIDWQSKIMPVKAMGADGSGSVVDIADGIVWATDHGANVINLSLGEYDDSDYLHEAIKYAHDKGTVVVAAMGNDGVSKPCYPAAYPEVIAVSAVDDTMQTASFSNFGAHCSVAAPGVSIPSTYTNNRYVALSGTSMASPHVAGVAALVKSVNPNLGPEDIRNILQTTADDLGPQGKDDYYGYGQINVARAVQAAAQNGGQNAGQSPGQTTTTP